MLRTFHEIKSKQCPSKKWPKISRNIRLYDEHSRVIVSIHEVLIIKKSLISSQKFANCFKHSRAFDIINTYKSLKP